MRFAVPVSLVNDGAVYCASDHLNSQSEQTGDFYPHVSN